MIPLALRRAAALAQRDDVRPGYPTPGNPTGPIRAVRPAEAIDARRTSRHAARLVALCVGLAVAVLAGAAAPAFAAGGPVVATPTSVGSLPSPYVFPRSLTQLPVVITPGGLVHFHVDALEALRAAEHASAMVSLHRREHPLGYAIRLWLASGTTPYWAVDFSYGGAVVAEADVDRFGQVTAVWTGALAVYLAGRGHYGGLFDSPWVVLSFAAAFLALFFNPRRMRRFGHLDALLLLGLFAIPYYLFDHTHFDASVITVYPLLLLVLARMLWIGLRRDPGVDEGAAGWPVVSTGLVCPRPVA